MNFALTGINLQQQQQSVLLTTICTVVLVERPFYERINLLF
jgi:hypothetical protein